MDIFTPRRPGAKLAVSIISILLSAVTIIGCACDIKDTIPEIEAKKNEVSSNEEE